MTRMRFTALTAAAILLGTGSAMAGGGAPVPEKPEGGPSSGRPTAVLDESKCASVWQKAKAAGDAAGYMVNFGLADTNNDGKISETEFKAGCKKGWVQEQASLPVNAGGGQTPRNPIE